MPNISTYWANRPPDLGPKNRLPPIIEPNSPSWFPPLIRGFVAYIIFIYILYYSYVGV